MLINIEKIGVVKFPDVTDEEMLIKEPKIKHLENGTYEGYWENNLISLKTLKQEDNKKTLDEKQTITTSKGELSLKTPIGDLSVAVMGLLMTNLPTFSRVLRTTQGDLLPDMTLEEFNSLYLEVVQKYQAIDKRFTDINVAIEQAETQEKLEYIEINYEDI